MADQNKITGIILAGGRSSRMGVDKGLLKFHGVPLASHVLQVVTLVTDAAMIISANPEYEKFGAPVYTDVYPGRGPLGGIHAGLFHSNTELNLVLGCDMPFIKKDFLEYLISKSGKKKLLVPVHGAHVEPLCGIYPRSLLPQIESLLLKGELIMQNVARILWAQMLSVPPERFDSSQLFRNINSPTDVESLK